MRLTMLFSKSSGIALGAAMALGAAVAISPQQAAAEGEVTKIVGFSANVFVPCADNGSGEVVALQATLILVENQDDGPPAEIGVWGNANGTGISTGDSYRGVVTSSPIPGSNTEYLTKFVMSGRGRAGAKFTLTRIGPLFQPPTEIIQVHCH